LDKVLQQCNAAFIEFYKEHWRCEHTIDHQEFLQLSVESRSAWPKGSEHPSHYRCVNFRNSHEKGHQFRTAYPAFARRKLRPPPVLQLGDFVGNFDIDSHMRDFVRDVEEFSRRPDVIKHHKNLAIQCKVGCFKSNTTCPGCLVRRPAFTFACGHMLCGNCLRKFRNRTASEGHIIVLDGCFLGCNAVKATFRAKPQDAGARLLSLDG
jgi:hypothetical protein